MIFARTGSSVQFLICGDALGGIFLKKGSPYNPFQKLLKKGFYTDGMFVQILIDVGVWVEIILAARLNARIARGGVPARQAGFAL